MKDFQKNVSKRVKMKAFVVAEIGSNWEGDVKKAECIIKECKGWCRRSKIPNVESGRSL